jgi:hypothetical protein
MATTPEAPKDGRDPNTNVPESVRAAAAKAEALHQAVYPKTDNPNTIVTDQPVQEDKPPAGASDLPPASTEAPAPTPYPGEPVDWEHRYVSMKGRHDKAQDSIKQMSEQIVNLQNVLATVNSMPGPSQVPYELRAESLLSADEVNDYGAEFLDVVGKKAREATSSMVAGLQGEIQDLKRQLGYVGGSIAQNARERMFGELDQHLPAWREINQDQKFFAWLALPDTYSGAIRHNLLKAAWDRNDTARSLAFFQGFLAEEAAVDPAYSNLIQPNGSQAPQRQDAGQPQQPQPNWQGVRQNGGVPLESFAAPGRAKAAAEIPAEKPLVKRSDITKFYADCAAGRYRGNEAEKTRLESMIFAASAEGRVVNS